MALVSAKQVALACGVHYKAVVCMARAGRVPFVVQDGEMLFDEDVAVPAVQRRGLRVEGGKKRCATCHIARPISEFRGAKHNAVDCSECNKAKKRAAREAAAKETGRPYRTKDDVARASRARREQRERRAAEAWESKMKRASERSHAQTLKCRCCGEEKLREGFRQSDPRTCLRCARENDKRRFRELRSDPERYRRRISNPKRRLRNRIDLRLRSALASVGCIKPYGVFRHLGYTVEDLKAHLEKTFLPGMTWQNMDLWHIDHIVPVAAFECTSIESPDFKRCWALSNLRAMWAADNLKKGASREFLL